MAKKTVQPKALTAPSPTLLNSLSWGQGITEIAGHNIEAAGREVVNELLRSGWVLLHVYTLKYRENGIWRERPMAILGRLKNSKQ